jgi:transposase
MRRGRVGDPAVMLDPDVAPALPDDVAHLKAMIVAQTAELAEMRALRQVQEAELAAARAGLIEQRFEIEALKSRLARLQRMTFGRSSEKLRDQVEQLELTLADIDEMLGEITPANDPADAQHEGSRRKPARRPLPEALPRDIVEHPAPCTCPDCGGALRPFGEDVTEILDYVPGSFRVIRHVRPKLSCRMCETIVQAPAPSLPIQRGRAGAGLLAHVLVAKYCDHSPLHRQAEIYAREDIDLSRSTLADMVGQVAALVRPLIDALSHYVMAAVARAKPGYGHTSAMDAPTAALTRPQSCTATHRTAKEPIHRNTCVASRASCRQMAMVVLARFTEAAGSSRPPAWRTHGANSGTCTRRPSQH